MGADHKGLDDLLTAGLIPERAGTNSIPDPEWTLKVSESAAGRGEVSGGGDDGSEGNAEEAGRGRRVPLPVT